MNDKHSTLRISRQVGIAIILVALLVRSFVCFRDVQQYAADPDAYRMIAETLTKTGVFGVTLASGTPSATAYRPPLYPYVLSLLVLNGVLPLYAIAALHTLLGCLTVLCTYHASRRMLGEVHSMRASILAASLVIVDPVLLQQSTLVMTETMATAIASLVFWWWARRNEDSSAVLTALVLGGLLAAAYLCRPTFLVWAGMLILCLALQHSSRRRFFECRQLTQAAIVAVTMLAAVGFWTLRNVRTIGHPVWATTHGGYTLLLGNNPLFYDYLRTGESGTTWDAGPFMTAYSHRYDADPTTDTFWHRHWDSPGNIPDEVTEFSDDRLSYDAAKATIQREPATFLWSCVVRIARLWSPIPHATTGRNSVIIFAVGFYYVVMYLAVGIGLWRLGGEIKSVRWWAVWSMLLTLTLVHGLYWSNIRMRAPIIPALAIMAAATIRSTEETDR